jgi:hypothetical protein
MTNNEYFLLIGGESSGPYTLEQLHELWLKEPFPLDTLYVRKGMTECRPIDEILHVIIAFRKAPPKPLPPPRKLSRTAFALRVGACALLILGAGVSIWLRNRPEPPPPDVVRALVEVSKINVTIVNFDLDDWTEKTLCLNGYGPEAFKCRLASLKARDTVTLSLTRFVNDQGDRFEPWNTEVSEVWIGGGGKDFHRFPVRAK